MLSPQMMSPSQELEARDKAFHLIKKYTSYTFLDFAIGLNQQFLDAFEEQLNNPPLDVKQYQYAEAAQKQHEGEYQHFLGNQAQLEEGLKILKSGSYKTEAYKIYCSVNFVDWMFDRYGMEHVVWDDAFYILLGLGIFPSSDIFTPIDYARFVKGAKNAHTDFVRLALIALKFRTACIRSTREGGNNDPYSYADIDTKRISKKWTYETLFNDLQWPVPRLYPTQIPLCPSYNTENKGQILTGEEIPVTGIYEPWFIDPLFTGSERGDMSGKVGCPNYFLKGAIATDYNREGTDIWEKVHWRLLWEDTRYAGGVIPDEEAGYIFTTESPQPAIVPPELDQTPRIRVEGGKSCLKTGYWSTPARKNSRQYFKQGEIMPNFQSEYGLVIWQFESE